MSRGATAPGNAHRMSTTPTPSEPGSLRVRAVVLLAWGAFAAGVAFLYVNLPPNPDQALYDQMGAVIAGGGVVYRDCADHNFPGAPLLHAAAYALCRDPLRSFRRLDAALLFLFTAAFGRAVGASRGWATGAVFLFLYPVMYATSGVWVAGQRDILAAHLGLLAGVCLLRRGAGGSWGWPAGAGLMLAAASLLKPTSLLYAPALLAADLATRRPPRRVALDHAAAWAAAAAALGLVAAAAGWAGVLGEWYDVAVRFNAQVYSRRTPAAWDLLRSGATVFVHEWHWYAALAALGAVPWARSGGRALLGLLAAGAAVTLVSVAAQRKGFGYHYGGCLPVLAALASDALARAGGWLAAPGVPWPRRAAAAAVIGVAAAGSASKARKEFGDQVFWHLGRTDAMTYYDRFDMRTIAETAGYVRDRSRPGETVWVYSYDPLINTLAGRRSPVRFTNVGLVTGARPPFARADRWLAEVRSALRDHPPRFIVLRRAHRPWGPVAGRPDYTALPADDDSPPARLVRGVLDDRYRPVRSFGSYDVYERRDDAHRGA